MNNINTMKKILACCFVIVLMAAAAVAGTLAYENGTFEGALQMAKEGAVVSVDIVWQRMDEEGTLVELVDQSQRPDLMPLAAEQYSENIISVRNTGTISSFNRVIIAVPVDLDEAVELIKGEGWTLTKTIEKQECEDETCNIYIYTLDASLVKEKLSSPVIKGVRLNKDLEQYGDTHILGNKIYNFSRGLRLKVEAQAVQQQFFTNPEDAFAKLAMPTNPWAKPTEGVITREKMLDVLSYMPVDDEDEKHNIRKAVTEVIFGRKADYADEISGCFSCAVDPTNPNGPWAYYKADVPADANDTNIAAGTKWKIYILSDVPVPMPTNCEDLFAGMTSLTEVDGSNMDTSKVTDMSDMFNGCKELTAVDVSGWDTSKVTNMSDMFHNCTKVNGLDVSDWDTSKVTDMSDMFNGCKALTTVNVSGWKTSNVTNLSQMFYHCYNINGLDVSKWNTANVKNVFQMFNSCSSLSSLDTSRWDMSKNVGSYGFMFYNCKKLANVDVDDWVTEKTTSISFMFHGCNEMTEIDVSDWKTSNVTAMDNAFNGCNKVEKLDVSNWDTSKVTTMWQMFQNCSSLTALDLTGWDTSNVKSMSNMFNGCKNLTELDISSFNVKKVDKAVFMFNNCSNLKKIYVSANAGWEDVAENNADKVMFARCTNLVGGKGTTFSSQNGAYAKIDDESGPGYFTEKVSG